MISLLTLSDACMMFAVRNVSCQLHPIWLKVIKKTKSGISDKLLLTRPPIATSRSSVRIRTMLGLREELAPWLHKVTQIRRKLNIFGTEQRKEPIFFIQLQTSEAECLYHPPRAL